jgi:ABC-type transport system substrate-binding protein
MGRGSSLVLLALAAAALAALSHATPADTAQGQQAVQPEGTALPVYIVRGDERDQFDPMNTQPPFRGADGRLVEGNPYRPHAGVGIIPPRPGAANAQQQPAPRERLTGDPSP